MEIKKRPDHPDIVAFHEHIAWVDKLYGKVSDSRHEQLQQQCQDFHEKHPEVWELFCKFTFDRINRGFKHYSVNGVFERIRWETDFGGTGVVQFKINNNHRPFYARRFMKMFPEHEGFFRTRTQTSKQEEVSKLPPLTPSYFDKRSEHAE